jgi:hypothetical protein
VEVEADLADRRDAGPPGQRLESRAVPVRIEVPGLVRMNAHRREDPVVPRGQLDRVGGIRQSRPGNQEPPDAGRARPIEQRRRREGALFHLKMAVAVGQLSHRIIEELSH